MCPRSSDPLYVVTLTTVCPRSNDPFYIVTYYIKWVTTSWTYKKMSYVKVLFYSFSY